MKKIFLLFILLFIFTTWVNAASDYENDYTLIDCVNWDNDTWVAFDSAMPYATLKEGIEKTIAYINKNINKTWNEETASWKVFNIKIECSFDDVLNNYIDLNFAGIDYNNKLLIEWINDNSFIISNTYLRWWSNITFKNANFIEAYYDSSTRKKHYFSNSLWIKIIDSYINLKDNENLWRYAYYRYYSNYDYYINKIRVENSVFDIDITSNYHFWIPAYMKNNIINFNNINWIWGYNIQFYIQDTYAWYRASYDYFNSSLFLSNEINFWWHTVKLSDSAKYINNKFTNFSWIELGSNVNLYINNYFENMEIIDISNHKNMINNIFKSGFTDTFDLKNLRRNFHINNILEKGLGWIYKKENSLKMFEIDITSSSLYKEIIWEELPGWLGEIYIIFK